VGEGSVAFALHGIAPTPSRGPFSVSFSLPNNQKATVAVFDVAGRQVMSREVGTMGAGRHSVTVGDRLRPGLYMVKLSQGAQVSTTRALIIQ